jgi:hypothetical protein
MRLIIAFVFAGMIFGQTSAQAKANPKLQNYFESEILKINNSVVSTENAKPLYYGTKNNDELFFMNRFRIYIRPAIGIEVDGLAQFLVQPELELLFLRYPAPGWVPYQPK